MRTISRRWCMAGLMVALSVATGACGAQRGEPSDLRAEMQRDLTTYFRARERVPVVVEYAYLREGPTVTGIAWPKYYLWVVARDSARGTVLAEGAARVAHMDSVVEVTHFFPSAYIAREPASVESVFPAPVVAEIRKRFPPPPRSTERQRSRGKQSNVAL
jgi:hypothetical protein